MIIRLTIMLAWSPLLVAASTSSSSSNGDRHRVHSLFVAQQENSGSIEQPAAKEQRLTKELTLTDYLQRAQERVRLNSAGSSHEDYLAAMRDLMTACRLVDAAPLEELERANSALNSGCKFSSLPFPSYAQNHYAFAIKARLRIGKLTQQKLHQQLATLPPTSTQRQCLFARPLTYLTLPEMRRMASVSRSIAGITKKIVPPIEAWSVHAYDLMERKASLHNIVSTLMLYDSPIEALSSIVQRYWAEPHHMRIFVKNFNYIETAEWYEMFRARETEVAARAIVQNRDANPHPANYRSDGLITPQKIVTIYGTASYLLHLLTGNPELLPPILKKPQQEQLSNALERHLPALYKRLRCQKLMLYTTDADALAVGHARKTSVQPMPTNLEAALSVLAQYGTQLIFYRHMLDQDACILNLIQLLGHTIDKDFIKTIHDWNRIGVILQDLGKNCVTSHTRSWLSACSESVSRNGDRIIAQSPTPRTKEEICAFITKSIPMPRGFNGRLHPHIQRSVSTQLMELESKFADQLSIQDLFLIAKAYSDMGPTLRKLKGKPAIEKLQEQTLKASQEQLLILRDQVKALYRSVDNELRTPWRKALERIETALDSDSVPSTDSLDAYIPSWDVTAHQIEDLDELAEPELPHEANALPTMSSFDFDTLND